MTTAMGNTTATAQLQVPDGRQASLEEMREFGITLQRFVRQQEATLVTVANPRRHNEIIDYLELVAGAYNTQLEAFRQAEAERHQAVTAMLLALRGLQGTS